MVYVYLYRHIINDNIYVLLEDYHLIVERRFTRPMTPRTMLVGAYAPGRDIHAKQVKE
jgi:hypothetical protein